jgi:tRNA A-37 threonylcarbamoyl transferase component Bud32
VGVEYRVLARGEWAQILLAELDGYPGAPWDWIAAHGRVLKHDRYGAAALVELGGEPCFAKLYLPRGRLHAHLLRSTRGRPVRSQDVARELLRVDVVVPQPRGCLWLGNSALTLAEGLINGDTLQQRWQTATGPAARQRLLSSVAESLARLHHAAYSHGDCKWSNLLCLGRQVYLVDLDAARHTPVGSRRQARDLARWTLNAEELSMEPSEYRVFLDSYFSALGAPREAIIARMLPQLYRLRDRHRRQYGETGRALW